MGKVQNLINEQKIGLKELIYNYTVTLIVAAFISIFSAITCEMDTREYEFIDHVNVIIWVLLIGVLASETFFVKRNEPKKRGTLAIAYAVSLLVAVIVDILGYNYNNFAVKTRYWLSTYFSLFFISLLGFALYRLIKINNISIEKYFARVIFGLLKIWGLFLLLFLATILILEMFDALIVEIDYWDAMEKVEILLAGFVYFPYSLMVMTDTREDNSRFTKGLFIYALMPCVFIATIIIYMYMIGMLIDFEIPSNEVFSICVEYFVLGGPIWLIAYEFLKEKAEKNEKPLGIYGKIVGNMAYIFSPCIILEIICIGIRIAEYGLTEVRYIGICLIVFQIIYVIWRPLMKAFKKNVGYEGLIFIAIIMLVIVSVTPIINVKTACYLSQKSRFEEALEEGDMEAVEGSYRFLESTFYGEAYLKENFTEKERGELLQTIYNTNSDDYGPGYTDYYEYEEYVYSRGVNYIRENGIDISEYSSMKLFSYYEYNKMQYDDKIILDIEINGEKQIISEVDFTECFYYFLQEDDSAIVEEGKPYIIDYDENTRLVISNIEFRINEYGKYIRSVDVEGYVLFK